VDTEVAVSVSVKTALRPGRLPTQVREDVGVNLGPNDGQQSIRVGLESQRFDEFTL